MEDEALILTINRAMAPLTSFMEAHLAGSLQDKTAYRRFCEEAPAKILEALREGGGVVRTREQADWPVTARAYEVDQASMRETLYVDIAIGDKVFGSKFDADPRFCDDPDYLIHVGRHAVASAIQHTIRPMEERVAQAVIKARKKPLKRSVRGAQ